MTPEQKAFCEYGEARGLLKARIAKCRRDARYVFGRNYQCLYSAEKKNLWITSDLKSYIKDYRQKQAACRAWTIPSHERLCENCAHGGTRPYETPCRECFRSTFALSYEMVSDNWEPRKEGK